MDTRWVATVVVCIAVASVPARAQTSAAGGDSPGLHELSLDDLVHEKITVTARKRTETLQDAPVSVSVVTGARLEQLNADNFAGYARTIPGLSFRDRGVRGLDLALRGVNAAYDGGIGQATVGVYLDEIPITTVGQQPNLDLFDIERVEVLRGPQGTLYGEGSMGGTLRIITRKPNYHEYQTQLESKLSTTEHGGDNYRLSALTNVPVVDDKLALRLGAYYINDDGFIDNAITGEKNFNDNETVGARLGLAFKAGERFSVLVQTLYEDKSANGEASYEPLLGYLDSSATQREPTADRNLTYSATVQADLGWSQLTSATAYATRATRDFQDSFSPNEIDSIAGAGQQTNNDWNTLVQELRLSKPSSAASRFSWVGGVFYSYKKNAFENVNFGNINQTIFGPPSTLPPELGVLLDVKGRINQRQSAVFGELDYALTRKLTLTAGLRYFDYQLSILPVDVTTSSPMPPTDLGSTVRSDASKLTKTLQVNFKATDRLLLYARAAEGFRVGGQNSNSGSTGIRPTYDPDTTWNYELGVKSNWLDHRVELSGAVYQIDWQDIQFRNVVELNNGGPFTLALAFSDNAGAAKINGTEIELNAFPMPGLSLQWALTYMNAHLSEDAPNGDSPILVHSGRKGNPIPFVPRFIGSFGLNYARSLPVRDLTLVANLNYQYYGQVQTQFNDGGGSNGSFYVLPAQNNLGTQMGVECASWSAKLFVDNLLDERLQLDRTPNRGVFGPLSSYGGLISTQWPRTVGVKLSKRFW